MPHVIPADAEKCSIYKTMESKVNIPVAYRTRQCNMLSVPDSTSFTWQLSVKTAPKKPRLIIVVFQRAKDGDQTKNPSTFDLDHVNLRNAYVMLNSDWYPAVEIRDIETGEIIVYSSMHKAAKTFSQQSRLISAYDGKEWRNRYAIKVLTESN